MRNVRRILLAVGVALAFCASVLPAWAAVIDISGTDINPDALIGAGNTGRVIANSSMIWSANITRDVDLNGYTLSQSAGGNNRTYSGALSGTGLLLVTAAPTLTISGTTANTFTGTYQVGGTLVLNKTSGIDAVNGTVNLTYWSTAPAATAQAAVQWNQNNLANDATVFNFGSATSTANTGRLIFNNKSDALGVLNLYSYGIMDMGASSTNTISFADSSAATWNAGKFIKIDNWGTSSTLAFAGLTAGQLSQIYFRNPGGLPAGTYSAKFASGSSGAIIPDVAVPNPVVPISGTYSSPSAQIGDYQDTQLTANTTFTNATTYINVDINGWQLQSDTGGGNAKTLGGQISGASGTLYLPQRNITIGGTAANTFAGLTKVVANTSSANIGLTLNKPAGLDAVAGNMQVDCTNATTGSNYTIVRWSANDQINDNSVVTLNPTITGTTGFPATAILRLNGKSDKIGGLTNTGLGVAIVENESGSANVSTLTVNPASGNTYTFAGRLRNGDGTGTDGTLALKKTGEGAQVLDAAGTYTYTGGTTVDGGTLIFNGNLTLNQSVTDPANVITVNSGLFNGTTKLKFINKTGAAFVTVGASGTFNANLMEWDLTSLTAAAPVTLVDYTSGGAFSGTLSTLLTPASQASWSLQDSGGLVQAVAVSAYAWKVDANGNWNNPDNWVTGVPSGLGAPANFLDKITADRTVTVDIPVTLGLIKFDNTNKYTIAGSDPNVITLDTTGGDASILALTGNHEIAAPMILNKTVGVTVSSAGQSLTISGPVSTGVSGSGLNKEGAGTLLLTGTNTFDGAVAVNAGTLKLSGGSALADTVAVTVAVGGTLALNAATDDESIGSLACNTATAVVNLNGGALRLTKNGASSTVAGLTGAGTIYRTGTGGTTTFTNNASFTGDISVVGGTLIATTAGALGNTVGKTILDGVTIPWALSATATDGESLVITGGTTSADTGNSTFALNAEVQSGATFLITTGGGNAPTFNGVLSGEGTFEVRSNDTSLEFNPTSLGGTAANTLSGTTKISIGTLDLKKTAGVDAVAGALVIGNGTNKGHVRLQANNQINDNSVVTIASNSDLRLNGKNETIGGLVSSAGQGAVGNYHATVDSTLTVQASAADSSFGGALVNGGAAKLGLVKSGDKTLTLGGTSTYSGPTTVAAGTLKLDAAGSIAASPTIDVASGAVLDVASVTGGFQLAAGQTLKGAGTVSGALTVTSGATLQPGSSPGALATDGQIWTNGGNYNWTVYDAAGAAGTGYSKLTITGGLDLSSLTPGGFNVNLWSLSSLAPDTSGDALNFNNASPQSWTLATTTTGIAGFAAGSFIVNTAANNGTDGFSNALAGGSFAVAVSGNDLRLNFTPGITVHLSTWTGTAGGNWGDSGKWNNGVPNAVGDTATFHNSTDESVDPAVVLLKANRTASELSFTSTGGRKYQIANDTAETFALTLNKSGGPASIAASGTNAHAIAAPIVAASNLNVTQSDTASLTLANITTTAATTMTVTTQSAGTLTVGAIGGGGSTSVAANSHLSAASIVQDTLSIGAGGSVIIRETPSAAGQSNASQVPEPGVLALLCAGAACLLPWLRRRQ
jgi:autotransporter-associated beta strand protein